MSERSRAQEEAARLDRVLAGDTAADPELAELASAFRAYAAEAPVAEGFKQALHERLQERARAAEQGQQAAGRDAGAASGRRRWIAWPATGALEAAACAIVVTVAVVGGDGGAGTGGRRAAPQSPPQGAQALVENDAQAGRGPRLKITRERRLLAVSAPGLARVSVTLDDGTETDLARDGRRFVLRGADVARATSVTGCPETGACTTEPLR